MASRKERSPKPPRTRGENMRLARERRGYSIVDLGELSGVHANTIASWEMNRTNPNLDSLILVANILHISLDEYIGRKVQRRISRETGT